MAPPEPVEHQQFPVVLASVPVSAEGLASCLLLRQARYRATHHNYPRLLLDLLGVGAVVVQGESLMSWRSVQAVVVQVAWELRDLGVTPRVPQICNHHS